jgi:voltage-gated potassium channel
LKSFRDKLFTVIFGTETTAGRAFDVALLWLIVGSVVAVMAESIPVLGNRFAKIFMYLEWVFTFLFTLEYLLRVFITHKPLKYIFSFWGIIDFLAIIPTYLGFIYSGYGYFRIIRTLRLLRVFRILKLSRYTKESSVLFDALRDSLYKISVFLASVLAVVIIMGTLLYVVEEDNYGFTSIPSSIYWAIVTVTTVGYGDVIPLTVAGKIIASVIMITGYAIIAIPTGIVTVELSKKSFKTKECPKCKTQNPKTSRYCHYCGKQLYDDTED